MKKLLLSLGTIAAATTPIGAVVACGDNTNIKGTDGKRDFSPFYDLNNVRYNDLTFKYNKHSYYIPKGASTLKVLTPNNTLLTVTAKDQTKGFVYGENIDFGNNDKETINYITSEDSVSGSPDSKIINDYFQ